ncbi:DUF6081 family protein [Streptomyces sp. NPDC018833]|uniref:DUF6081 family protein n=1 Tax=Streptomyces sp. NPDC018833 TaxID=3365053 RepID=UPI00378EBD60
MSGRAPETRRPTRQPTGETRCPRAPRRSGKPCERRTWSSTSSAPTTRVHAFHERLPKTGSTYTAFSYALLVATRQPGPQHDLAIAFDNAAGKATWKADGREVLGADDLGRVPADRGHLTSTMAAPREKASPRHLSRGIGMFTLLDGRGARPSRPGEAERPARPLLRPGPRRPGPERFLDEASRSGNRLWCRASSSRWARSPSTHGRARSDAASGSPATPQGVAAGRQAGCRPLWRLLQRAGARHFSSPATRAASSDPATGAST